MNIGRYHIDNRARILEGNNKFAPRKRMKLENEFE